MSIILVLEVAISMVFLYLVGSQIVLSLHELWAGFTNRRGVFLYERLAEVLGAASARGLYAAPEITNLSPNEKVAPTPANTQGVGWWRRVGLPPYMQADLFAATLLRLAAPGATTAAAICEALRAAPAPPPAQSSAGTDQSPPAFVLDPQARALLLGLLQAQAPATELAQCQKVVAVWYDALGERLTGWYKKSARVRLFVLGLVFAFAVNVDSLHILSFLWLNPQVSHDIATGAATQTTQPRPPDLPRVGTPGPAGGGQPVGGDSASVAKPTEARFTQQLRAELDTLNARKSYLHKLGFPLGRANDHPVDSAALPATFYVRLAGRSARLGRYSRRTPAHYLRYQRRDSTLLEDSLRVAVTYWKVSALPTVSEAALQEAGRDRTGVVSDARPWQDELLNPQPQQHWLLTWGGWLLTAAALSVGAPFWFDLLCRLVNVRNLGIKPPRTGHE